jgi:L-ascorbate metabolism protein UlaG (beta-lactamase superfamily)
MAVLAVAGCFRSTSPGVQGRVDVAPPGLEAVRFVYLGVGGWIIERGDDQVLAAPLFSNPSLVRTGLLSVRSDTAIVDRHMAPHDVSEAKAILVGHAHYDHLMDVPRVARRHAPGAKILGSAVVRYTLGTWSGVADRVLEIDGLAGDEARVGEWIVLGDGLRVMALRSHHAPHFEGYTLYKGSLDRPLTEEPRWASEWLDGPTYAFLVDFLGEGGSVEFRVYYQDAVSAPPRGFAPAALMAERPVDVAIFVPATFDQVDWHPEAFVENLGPRWVLLGHWENFFRPPEARTKSVVLSDIGHFQDRLDRVFSGTSWLPELGTEFRFPLPRR